MSQKKQRTGRPTSTSQEEILLAAEQLLQEGGETALSFRRLATKLGLSAPSIYTYFPSKQALLKALTDSTINLDFSTEQNLTPAKALSHLLTQLRQRLHEKQHLMGLFNQAMPAASMIQLIEQLADIIEKTGIEHGVALRYGQSLLWMVLGFVLFENSSRNEDVRIPFTDIPEYAETLAHLDVEQHERLWQETLERNLLFLEIRGNKYATQ